MKFTPTLIHGIADYTMSALLVVAPWLLGFAHNPVARNCTVAFGLAALVYSLCTDYELGLARVIPMRIHLLFDAISAALLIGAPFMMNFAATTWVPHLVLGIVWLAAVAASAVMMGMLRPADWRQRGGGGMAR